MFMKEEIDKTGSKNVFQKLIHDLLLENNHRNVLNLFPSTSLAAEQIQVRELNDHLQHEYQFLSYKTFMLICHL